MKSVGKSLPASSRLLSLSLAASSRCSACYPELSPWPGLQWEFSYLAVAAFVSCGPWRRLRTAGPPAGCPSLLSHHPLRAQEKKIPSAQPKAGFRRKHKPRCCHFSIVHLEWIPWAQLMPTLLFLQLETLPGHSWCHLQHDEIAEGFFEVETGQFNQCIWWHWTAAQSSVLQCRENISYSASRLHDSLNLWEKIIYTINSMDGLQVTQGENEEGG